MQDNLAQVYRPQSLSDVVGQDLTVNVLQRMLEAQRIPRSLLFSGPSGSGKTTVARIVAGQVATDDFNIIEIDAASHGTVAEIRSLLTELSYSAGSSRRVLILDEAQSMSKEAFDTILKTLEEPPSGVYFLFLTTDPRKIPEMVKTRTLGFEFTRLSVSEIVGQLQKVCRTEDVTYPIDLLTYLAVKSDGSLRQALMLLEKLSWSGVTSLSAYRAAVRDYDFADEMVSAMWSANIDRVFSVLDSALMVTPSPEQIMADLVHLFRDTMVLRAGGEIVAEGESLVLRKQLANLMEHERVLHALRVLWDMRVRIKSSSDVRGDAELAVALVYEVLSRGHRTDDVKVVVDVDSSEEMSLTDLMSGETNE